MTLDLQLMLILKCLRLLSLSLGLLAMANAAMVQELMKKEEKKMRVCF